MQKKKTKVNKAKIIIATIVILTLAIGCSTTNRRDKELVRTLEQQNKAITSTLQLNGNINSDNMSSEQLRTKALKAIYESNKVIISKLKPLHKKECNCGKNEESTHGSTGGANKEHSHSGREY